VNFTEIQDASKQIVDSAKGLQTKILVEGLGVGRSGLSLCAIAARRPLRHLLAGFF
jgi:hypothetical protein